MLRIMEQTNSMSRHACQNLVRTIQTHALDYDSACVIELLK